MVTFAGLAKVRLICKINSLPSRPAPENMPGPQRKGSSYNTIYIYASFREVQLKNARDPIESSQKHGGIGRVCP